jgi:hypothetical protein
MARFMFSAVGSSPPVSAWFFPLFREELFLFIAMSGLSLMEYGVLLEANTSADIAIERAS